MGFKKIILNIILGFINIFLKMMKINAHQVAFVSLESAHLESDLLLIYDELSKDKNLIIKKVLIGYDKNNLIQDFLYMLNCIRQIIIINTSKVVFIRDNNYVISNFKREEVKVIQVWHACGAIKKFGNVIDREYPIQNYDYVLSNSDYWKEPYSQAFGITQKHVMTTGMPRVDCLCQKEYLQKTRKQLLKKYPMLEGKRVILYAPTFRGNIYKGFQSVPFDALKVMKSLGEDDYLLYKFHPLLKDVQLAQHDRIINMNHEDTHALFTISDILVSDFSSIIFDYSLLNKPMCFFVPDLDQYLENLGCFVDYHTMPGPICHSENELISALSSKQEYDVEGFKERFFKYQDGHNIDRVINMTYQILNDEEVDIEKRFHF